MKFVFGLFFFISLASGSVSGQKVFNVKDFGAKGNGRKDDKAAIQRAVDAASNYGGGVVFFPRGTYLVKSYTRTENYLENYMIRLKPNIEIKGVGDLSVIKLGSNLFNKVDKGANAHLFYGLNNSSVSFSDIGIDMNGQRNLVPKGALKNYSAIFTKRGSDYRITDVTIRNTAGRTMVNIMGKGNGLSITRSQFLNGGPNPGNKAQNPYQNDFSFIYSEWENTVIVNNKIEQQNVDISLTHYNGGIELHGNDSRAIGNMIKGCWPAVFVTSSSGETLENIVVSDNSIEDCLVGISFWLIDTMENIEIKRNSIHLTYPRNSILRMSAGILMPNGNAQTNSPGLANNAPIIGLDIDSNKIDADSMSVLSAGLVLHSLANGGIYRNTITGMNYAGILLSGSKFGLDSIDISNNKMSDFRPNHDPNSVAGFLVATDTYQPVGSQNSGFSRITVSQNEFLGQKRVLNGDGKFFGSFIALPRKSLNNIKFNNNRFSDPALLINKVETK